MSTRLIIDGNAVYEIDEACEAGKKRFAEETAESRKQKWSRGRGERQENTREK